MSDRYCERCGRIIVPSLDGTLCSKCLDKKLYYSEFYYDTGDMSQNLGVGEVQVRRKARKGEIPGKVPGIKRYLFIKGTVDEWIRAGQPIPRVPNSPVQEKAFAMCKREDHSWMGEEEYAGNSYNREVRTSDGQFPIIVGFVHTCYFCAHKEWFYS